MTSGLLLPGLALTLTSLAAVANGLVVGLQQLVKVALPPSARLSDHGLPLLQLLPQPRVYPAVP